LLEKTNCAANRELCVLYPAPGTVKNDSQRWIPADWRAELPGSAPLLAGFLFDREMMRS
jgi:hypothetical protein